jgi:1-phosphofructokinase family hexose kinase
MIVCAAASPSVDKLFAVERLRAGEVHRPREFVQLPGGKAINVARAATTLGAEVEVAALAGGHVGEWLVERLCDEGIVARFARTRAETRAALSVLDRASGRLTEFYEGGETIEPADWEAFSTTVESSLRPGGWLAIAGSLPQGAPADGYARLVSRAGELGVRAAIDARGEALALALDAGPKLVKVNSAEASEALATAVIDLEAALAAAATLRAWGSGNRGRVAIVTCGEDGAVMAGPAQRAWRGRVDALGPYSVGSGDAFLAGLLVELERRRSWTEAFRLALGAAAANAEQPGPGRLDARRAAELRDTAELEAW